MLNNLEFISNVLQVVNYLENARQTSNDEIMKALEQQNQDYLEIAIRQNVEIIERLERLENARKNKEN